MIVMLYYYYYSSSSYHCFYCDININIIIIIIIIIIVIIIIDSLFHLFHFLLPPLRITGFTWQVKLLHIEHADCISIVIVVVGNLLLLLLLLLLLFVVVGVGVTMHHLEADGASEHPGDYYP